MPRRPKNAVVGHSADSDAFIGHFAMFTNPDEAVPGSKFLKSWATHGLNVDDLPEARQPVHVFQSACASVKARIRDSKGARTEITADEIQNSAKICQYQITTKIWDRKDEQVVFERGLRVSFDKANSQLSFDEFDPRLGHLAKQIEDHFHSHATKIPGPKVRNAVREQIIRIGGQNLRRKAGGVYYVPKQTLDGEDTKPILDGLAAVLSDLYGEHGDLYALPMLNQETERDMIAKHFVINVASKSEELAVKAMNRVRQGKGERAVRADLLANLWNERRQISAQVKQYQELVGLEGDRLKDNLSALDEALEKLQNLADEGTEA